MVREILAAFRRPMRVFTRPELIADPSLIPAAPGIYGWYFNEMPHPDLPGVRTRFDEWSLLYIGIAPGRAGSNSNLRTRINTHLRATARRSTLRLTLGSLLKERLELQPSPASGKISFGSGEIGISNWLDAYARIAWVECPEPWEVEAEVVRALGVPLNRAHNQAHPFYPTLGELRRASRVQAPRPPQSDLSSPSPSAVPTAQRLECRDA